MASRFRCSIAVLATLTAAVTAAPAAWATEGPPFFTETTRWDSANPLSQSWSTGEPFSVSDNRSGWLDGPFSSIGVMGLDFLSGDSTIIRRIYQPFEATQTSIPGASHSFSSAANVNTNTVVRNRFTVTTAAVGNSISWQVAISEQAAGSLPRVEFFLHSDFAPGATPEFLDLGEGRLLVTDSSDDHAAALVTVTTTSGTPRFTGRSSIAAPLANGDRELSVYVDGFTDSTATVTVTATILDYDPCAKDSAVAWATAIGYPPFGEALEPFSHCLALTSWQLVGGESEPAFLPLILDSRLPTIGQNEQRIILPLDAPEGLSLEPAVSGEGIPGVLAVADADVEPGTYSVSITSVVEDSSVEPPRLSQSMSQEVMITVEAPPPPPAEPEPEPEPESLEEGEPVVAETEAPLSSPVFSRKPRSRPVDMVDLDLVPLYLENQPGEEPLSRDYPTETESTAPLAETPRFEFQEVDPPQEITSPVYPPDSGERQLGWLRSWWTLSLWLAGLTGLAALVWLLARRRRDRSTDSI